MTVEWRGPRWFRGAAERLGLPLFHRVTALHLGGRVVDDAMLESIASLRRLRSLSLSHANVTPAGLECLSRLPELEEMTLTGKEINDESLQALSRCRNLKRLTLAVTSTTPGGMDKLRRALPGLAISIDGNALWLAADAGVPASEGV